MEARAVETRRVIIPSRNFSTSVLFHLPVFFAAALFGLGLSLIGWYGNFFGWIVIGLLAIGIRHAMTFGRRLPAVLNTPVIFVLSSALLLSFIGSPLERWVFVACSSTVYYLLMLGLYRLSRVPQDLSARAMVAMVVMATAFFFFSTVYGFYLNFDVPLWFLMAVYGIGTFSVTYQSLLLIGGSRRTASVYGTVAALGLSEIAWVVNFWPFGYLTSGVVTLMFFFVLFDLAQSNILNTLSKRRSLSYVGIFAVLLTMVLYSSRWLPVG